jgi:hypothetical protein
MSKHLFVSLFVLLLVRAVPVNATSCHAETECQYGPPISCNGLYSSTPSCSAVAATSVTCNGNTTYCAPSTTCSSEYICPSPPFSASWLLFCNFGCGTADYFNHTMTCGSTVTSCQACEDTLPFYSCLSW